MMHYRHKRIMYGTTDKVIYFFYFCFNKILIRLSLLLLLSVHINTKIVPIVFQPVSFIHRTVFSLCVRSFYSPTYFKFLVT